MAKKKTKPRPKPRPRPGYRVYLPWLLLLALIAGCADRPREVPADFMTPAEALAKERAALGPGIMPVEPPRRITALLDTDADGMPDQTMAAVAFASDVIGEEVDIDADGIMDAWLTAEVARTPDGDYPELAGVDLSDVKADALASASEQAETQACIPWGSGCSTGGCCAPFSCMWTGVGINRKKKCCSGTSGSPFYNCQ